MDKPSDLSRVAELLADEPQERFLVLGYDVAGEKLAQAEMIEAPSAEAALNLGQSIAEWHSSVVVMSQTEDWLGTVRSVVIATFERH